MLEVQNKRKKGGKRSEGSSCGGNTQRETSRWLSLSEKTLQRQTKSFTELQPPLTHSHTSKVQCCRHIPICDRVGGRAGGRRGSWKRGNDLQKYSPAAPLAVCGPAHPRSWECTTKGRGKETGTLHPVSCCEPIFPFCMPGQRTVCSTQLASSQFRSVMRANKLPRPLAPGGTSRRNSSFLLCLFPPLMMSLMFEPTAARCCIQEE